MNTGDKVMYIGDVHTDYTNKVGTAMNFDLKHRLVDIKFDDDMTIPAFWDEIVAAHK